MTASTTPATSGNAKGGDDAQPAVPAQHPSATENEASGDTTATYPKPAAKKVSPAEEVAAKLGVAPTAPASHPRQRKRASFWFRQWLTLSQTLDPCSSGS